MILLEKIRRWTMYHIYWPILCRFYAGRSKRFRLSNDLLFDYPMNGIIARALLADDFEKAELRFVQSVLQAGDIVFDIGANCGIYTIVAAKIVGSGGCVYSFEPSHREQEILQHNIKLNHLSNVIVIGKAVSDMVGTSNLLISMDGAMNSLAKNLHPAQHLIRSEEVETISIDHFVQKYNISRVDLVKIDVEGAEHRVFAGMRHLISSQSEMVVLFESAQAVASGFGYQVIDFLTQIRTLGLQLYYLDDMILNKVEEDNPKIGREIYNFIAVKGNILLKRGCLPLDNDHLHLRIPL